MALSTQAGDVVTFLVSAVTQAGVVIGFPTTTTNLVAYDFALVNGSQLVHCKEFETTSITKVSSDVD